MWQEIEKFPKINLYVSDGSSITWFEPPPFEIVTDPATVSEVNKSLIKGSLNEEVSCNFTLTSDLSLITVSMKLQSSSIATYVQSQHALSVQPGFESRFNATWVPNRLTLILFDVTSADEGEYRCEVLTLGISVQTWARVIQVSLRGKLGELAMIVMTKKPLPVANKFKTYATCDKHMEIARWVITLKLGRSNNNHKPFFYLCIW